MTDDELAVIEERWRKASGDRWEVRMAVGKPYPYLIISTGYIGGDIARVMWDEAVDFIVCAHNTDVPELIAEVRRLREELARLESAWLVHETIQPDGELGATVGDVVRENERLSNHLASVLRIANDRLAAKDSMASIQEAETLWEIVRAAEEKE